MATFKLGYGHGTAEITIPEHYDTTVLYPHRPTPPANESGADEAMLVAAALRAPIGSPRLRDLALPGQRVVIITSDLTRPCPSERLLPPLLDELAEAGIPDGDVTVVVALGLHRSMTEAELEETVGPDVYRRVRVVNHDPDDVIPLGITARGTPVEFTRVVMEADLRVGVGNLELHYFVGYSGGAKAILPGCASRATVQANHAMMVEPEAAAGRLEGNPVRADLEEGAALAGIDFILNVVVDGQHRIVGAVAGDVTAAHRQGCDLVAQQGIVALDRPADIVLVSAGGYPKDVNLYQAQKALDNAAYAVRDGGSIVLLAECGEGLGNTTFEDWMRQAGSPDEVLERIRREFVLGGHKAAAVASVLKRADIYFVSSMPPDLVQECGLVPFADAGRALEIAIGRAVPAPHIVVMPEGGSVLPKLPV